MFELNIDMEGLQQTLRDAMLRGQDLQPALKVWAREKRLEVREIIDSGRGMPPLSPRTLENYASTGTSKITKRGGNVRASYARRLETERKRLEGLERYSLNRWGRVPSGIQKKIDNYQIRLARFGEQVEKARDKDPSERSSGATQADRGKGGKILGQVPQTLYGSTAKNGLHAIVVVGSKWKKDWHHNEGDEHNPKREHITLTGRDVQRCKTLVIDRCIKPFRGGK